MLTSARNTTSIARGLVLRLPVAAGVEIFEGSLVVLDVNGFAKPAEQEENLTAAGRAETYADNSKGQNGEITVGVLRGAFVWDNDPTAANKVTRAHVMKPCYILDDCTVTSLSTGSSPAGKVLGVTDEGVVVETV